VDDQTIKAIAPLLPKVDRNGFLTGFTPPYTTEITVLSEGIPSPSVVGDQFTYLPAPAPTITSISPTSGPASGGTTVLVKGNGFTGAISASFASQDVSFTVLDDATISFVTPKVLLANNLTAQSEVSVTTTWGGTSGPTPADQFTYLSAPPPTITSLSPTSGPASGGTTLLIKGSGFTGATAVSIGLPAASLTVLDDSTISAVTPSVFTAASGWLVNVRTVDVTETTPGGGTSAPTPADQFTYLSGPVPTLTSISPTSGPASGGTTILIKGSGFSQAVLVSIGIGIPVSSFTVLDDSTISVVTPNVLNPVTNQPNFGTVGVRVTTPGGTSALTSADQFTYLS
jgi:hypothetical protein